ncbi:glutamine amidotransferase [Mesorhizobium sp. YM1C-6-2]|uniref:glutamine amidotransferase n=1 Tax=Mesorhizobium sp. YM1C-6-2 TaxID=1827501 RepID=UPI001AECB43A|nr:glutamine amidotransferase [Mesorhizobium sp. YM1C-6-2]
MSKILRVLFAGESWFTHTQHVKGFDSFEECSYGEGGDHLIEALRGAGIDVTYFPNHIANRDFPMTREEIDKFDVVILSDIGANTLLLPRKSFNEAQRTPNRLDLIRDYVQNGGGFLMVGGYLTFQGIQAKGNWAGTAVDAILPVELQHKDDRSEHPEGITPVVAKAEHPIVQGLPAWPHLLGYNRAALRPDSDLIVTVGNDPLVAVREVGKGRTGVFSSDCGPHWGPPEFVNWEGYPPFWTNLVRWLAKQ